MTLYSVWNELNECRLVVKFMLHWVSQCRVLCSAEPPRISSNWHWISWKLITEAIRRCTPMTVAQLSIYSTLTHSDSQSFSNDDVSVPIRKWHLVTPTNYCLINNINTLQIIFLYEWHACRRGSSVCDRSVRIPNRFAHLRYIHLYLDPTN